MWELMDLILYSNKDFEMSIYGFENLVWVSFIGDILRVFLLDVWNDVEMIFENEWDGFCTWEARWFEFGNVLESVWDLECEDNIFDALVCIRP